jgi:hypothetical protein
MLPVFPVMEKLAAIAAAPVDTDLGRPPARGTAPSKAWKVPCMRFPNRTLGFSIMHFAPVLLVNSSEFCINLSQKGFE